MLVARVKQIKEETHTFMELKDLGEIVINTMGEDMWNAILYFTEKKTEELEEDIRYLKSDTRSDDNTIYSLRNGIREEIDTIKELIDKVDQAKRLDRRVVIKELQGIIKRLEGNEGFF